MWAGGASQAPPTPSSSCPAGAPTHHFQPYFVQIFLAPRVDTYSHRAEGSLQVVFLNTRWIEEASEYREGRDTVGVVFPYMLITAHRPGPRSHHKAGLLTPVD